MKLEFQPIQPNETSFLTISHHTRSNPCHVFWHYHPEFELVMILGGSGRRRISTHTGQYTNGDLVLIGANIPHLNFASLAGQDHEEIIMQFSQGKLLNTFSNLPELDPLATWLSKIETGVLFGESTKVAVYDDVLKMGKLPPAERVLAFLSLLNRLSQQTDLTYLDRVVTGQYQSYDQVRIDKVYKYVQKNYSLPIKIDEVVSLTGFSQAAFCRFFRRMTNMTFTGFLTEFRIHKACERLLTGESITSIAYACGFNNISHFNVSFRNITGTSPTQYRNQWSLQLAPSVA